MPEPTIDILLATYNGERYLREQLASLMAQSDQGFRILARDDGSTDGTLAVLTEFAASHPQRLVVITSATARPGACGNFAELMRCSSASAVMWCDQDDLWHPDKVAVSRQALVELEATHGPALPALVHSDLRVVDDQAREVSSSMAALNRLRLGDSRRLARNLMQNGATGCTMIANRALVELCLPIPAAALMHDYWIVLVASAFGQVAVIDRALIDYRQHAGNAIGAGSSGGLGQVQRFQRLHSSGLAGRLAKHIGQADAFLDRYRTRLAPAQLALCEDFVRIRDRSWIGRRWVVVRHGLWMSSLLRNLMLLLSL